MSFAHLRDSAIVLRRWSPSDAEWYACCARDAEIQRFTSDPSTLTAADVVAAISVLSSDLDLQVIRLWTHADNAPSRAAAERAGFTRDRAGDRLREVKGEVWPTVAYELRRRTAGSTAPPPQR